MWANLSSMKRRTSASVASSPRRSTTSHGEAAGDELAGADGIDAAGAEIEDFLIVDLRGGAAVRAFHLVGVDFQAGHGVGLAGVAHQQVAAGLIGVGVVRVLVHEDEAGEDGLRVIVERVLVEQIRVGAFGNVVLEGALVVFLLAGGDGDREHVRARARAFEAGQAIRCGPRRRRC